MREELDKKLCEKYPKIFVNRHSPATETCMCWGFECGDGWFNILDHLCSNIQYHIDWRNKSAKEYGVVTQVVAEQVKEKYGTLRFYHTGGDDYIDGLVQMAESISSATCEMCGNSGYASAGGWISTLCEKHHEEREFGK